jgi:hypothetical protein
LALIDGSSLLFATDAFLDEDRVLARVPVKRGGDGREEPAGMWFGPRLGKRNKRSFDVPWPVFTVRGKFISTFYRFPKDFSVYLYSESCFQGFISIEAILAAFTIYNHLYTCFCICTSFVIFNQWPDFQETWSESFSKLESI